MSETITVASLREQLLPAIARAIALLEEEVSGQRHIENDFQLRACMQLARLAPFVLAQNKSAQSDQLEEEEMQELPPDLPLEEAERLFAIIEADGQPQSDL
jgi:hypothetical protein